MIYSVHDAGSIGIVIETNGPNKGALKINISIGIRKLLPSEYITSKEVNEDTLDIYNVNRNNVSITSTLSNRVFEENIDNRIRAKNPSTIVRINVYIVFSKYSIDDVKGSIRKLSSVYLSFSDTNVTILIKILMKMMNNHRDGITN